MSRCVQAVFLFVDGEGVVVFVWSYIAWRCDVSRVLCVLYVWCVVSVLYCMCSCE